MTRRATLGIDGNAGFALLGENIQEGECEFEVIESQWRVNSAPWEQDAKRAINRAFTRLKGRCGPMSYYLHPSHPSSC